MGALEPLARPQLSDAALSRVARLAGEIDALQALAELVALLDPDMQRTQWGLAVAIADRLHRFERTSWLRIRSGAREPRDSIERLLSAVASCPRIPRDARRLWDLLAPRA